MRRDVAKVAEIMDAAVARGMKFPEPEPITKNEQANKPTSGSTVSEGHVSGSDPRGGTPNQDVQGQVEDGGNPK